MTRTPFQPSREQQSIIDHPLQPLRVAAGAGTGKTTTIVERLAARIDDGMPPEAALGITFTNKAAEELADRLRSRLRTYADDGREVEVTTYHGFAYRILDEFGAVVGVERGSTVVGPGYVRQLLHEAVGDGPYDHLDLTFLSGRIDEAANLAGQLAGHLLQPQQVIEAAPSTTGVWGARIELATLLDRYADTKRRLGVVDYGDLVRSAHRLINQHSELAARLRSRYRMVVLDEYQDTDPGQRELLRSLFGGGFPVTAVGDADQTIYEWRGASLRNFQGFDRHFPTAEGEPASTLPLTLNRRSGPTILGVANAVRTELHGAPPDDPLRTDSTDGDAVATAWFRTAQEESRWIAAEIRRLHDEEAVAWREIGVLFRKNRHMAALRDALEHEDVPVEVASLGGLLTVPEVADIHAWLRILGRPDDDVALSRVLLGSRYRMGMADLVPLAAWVRHRVHADTAGDDAEALPFGMLEAIDRIEEIPALDPDLRTRLDDFSVIYRELLTDAQGATLVELVRRIVDRLDGWAEVEAMPAAQSLSARLNLYRFIDLVEQWSPLTGRPSLEGFLGYLDVLQDESAPDELDMARISGEDAVSLVTVHRSKGLEWDMVFVPAVARHVFPSRSQGFDDPERAAKWLPYELRLDAVEWPPSTLSPKERTEQLKVRHDAQELRTAYVAVTRARRRLTVTGSAWSGGKQPREPGLLLELVKGSRNVDIVTWTDDPGEPPMDTPTQPDAPDPHFAEGWRETLRQRIESPEAGPTDDPEVAPHRTQLTLELEGLPTPMPADATETIPTVSVTGLVTLAGCPRQFYWSEIDRLPRRPSPWLRRGSAIHRRIELHHRGVSTFEDLAAEPSVGQHPPTDSTDPFTSYLGSRFAGETPRQLETAIDLNVGGVHIRGRVDAVFESQPGVWEIVDYKSGRPNPDPTAEVQLQAYAVAAAEGALGTPPEHLTVTFAYLGTDPVTERSVVVDDEWLAAANARLLTLTGEVTGDVFEPVPSTRCRRCDFSSFCKEGARWLAADVESANRTVDHVHHDGDGSTIDQ